jgi:hypothetical protein
MPHWNPGQLIFAAVGSPRSDGVWSLDRLGRPHDRSAQNSVLAERDKLGDLLLKDLYLVVLLNNVLAAPLP